MADERGKLFEFAVLYHPKPKKVGDDVQTPPSILVVEPERIVARDEKAVAITASRKIPDEYLDKLEDVEVVVRPF